MAPVTAKLNSLMVRLEAFCASIRDIDRTLPESDRVYIMDAKRCGSETIVFGDSASHARRFLLAVAHFAMAVEKAGTRAGTFLDFGCGTGFSGLAMAHLFPALKIYGADIDEHAKAIALKRNAVLGLNFHIGEPPARQGHGLLSVFSCRDSLRHAPLAFFAASSNADVVVMLDRNDNFLFSSRVFAPPLLRRRELNARLSRQGFSELEYAGFGFPPKQLFGILPPLVSRAMPLAISPYHVGMFAR